MNHLPDHVTRKGDMELIAKNGVQWIDCPKNFPITYTYGGKTFHALPEGTRKSTRALDANMVETVYTGKVPGSQVTLRVECVTYRDFPVVEWTGYFTNDGEENSAILEDVWAADMTFEGVKPVLYHSNGDYFNEDCYTEKTTTLEKGERFVQFPMEGRACNGAWPYQRLMFDTWGLNIAIGWPSQWESVYEGGEGKVSFKARQQTVHTYLMPGETLRTPRMCVMAFEGDVNRGINMWRRWMNAHVTPKVNGHLVKPVASISETGPGEEHTGCTDTIVRNAFDKLAQMNLGDQLIFWLDAGWYPCYVEPDKKKWAHTGTWQPDRSHFPFGMGSIGRWAHELGVQFLLWYEPERARPGTELFNQHPEWMLTATITDAERATATDVNQYNDDNYMVNLADDACCEWVCKTIDALIKESKQDCYRQDFNFSPLPYWRCNEAEDRKGMLENKYQQNYLKFWDYLLEHNPNLWIDSCASGGRRNDLESMRRSVPLHPTDYGYGYHPINQAYRRLLQSWIPFVRAWNGSWLEEDGVNYIPLKELSRAKGSEKVNNYDFVNGFGSLLSVGSITGIAKDEETTNFVRKMLEIWREFADIQLKGDYYALTEDHRSAKKWTIFQFELAEEGKGAFQVLRNTQAEEESKTVKPCGICPCAEYILRNGETGETYTVSGAELVEKGITFTQPKRSGAVWFYEKK